MSRFMSPAVLIIKEAWHRKLNFLLAVLAIVTAVALLVGFFTTSRASRRETIRVTRDIGFNLRIIPKDTDMDRFWVTGFSEQTLPEDTVRRFANYKNVFFSYNHLVASLQQHYQLQGKEIILTGLAPTITAPAQRKRPMGFQIDPGTVHVGFVVAQRLGLKKGDTLALGSNTFQVARCMVENGTDDDIRVFGLLSDVQRVLHMEGRINEIKAIDCLCLTADRNPAQILKAELAKALPEARVIQIRALANARAQQRQMAEKYAAFTMPFLLVVSAIWIGVLAVMNVRERKHEIGILRALGRGSGAISVLFLGRAALIGLVGAALGFLAGSVLALHFGPAIFKVTAKAIQTDFHLLLWALVGAPLFAALSGFIPAMLAVTQDPAVTLRDE
jgi:putative ABC transport system permease protein